MRIEVKVLSFVKKCSVFNNKETIWHSIRYLKVGNKQVTPFIANTFDKIYLMTYIFILTREKKAGKKDCFYFTS